MSSSWIEYNPTSMKPVAICWNNSRDNLIEISKDLAVDLLTGKEKLDDYIVVERNKVLTLTKNRTLPAEYKKFSKLKELQDHMTDLSLTISNNVICIRSSFNLKNAILYASLKNDPSWLVATWFLQNELHTNGKVEIFFQNAADYTYFLRSLQ